MKVNVQTPHFRADRKLIDYIRQKLSKLEVYYNRIIFADVYLKLQRSSEKQNKIVEVLLSVPGDEFIVKKESKSFEKGMDECLRVLERLLKKKKEKIRLSV